ncbi:hypothetical protein F0562_034910 [Nyssa sinensis]|uniref:Pectinesterase inhibitor domain-containing protein n=1 Tax=Nyssa sinensis TaxID=561372 RepID=A0A5J5A8H1_9ASTE|nr:hypothetical protein F0562_034910 [Nyssa sinensis]
MEPHGYQRLLIIAFFSLIVLHFANATCVPLNCTNTSSSDSPSPSPSRTSSIVNKLETVSFRGVHLGPSPDSPSPSSSPSPSPSPAPSTVDKLETVSFRGVHMGPSPDHISVASISNQLSRAGPLSETFTIPKLSNPAVKKICDSTDNSALCQSSISPYLLDSKAVASPSLVLKMAIQASTDQTKTAISSITTMAGLPTTPPDTVSILNECKEGYNDALENFQSAMDALLAGDIGTMTSMLSAAITDYGDCEELFFEESAASPLVDHSKTLMNMVGNCLAISNLIAKHE